MSTTVAARAASATARRRVADALQATGQDGALVALLLAPPGDDRLAVLAQVRVERLLRAVPGIGEGTAVRVCRDARVERVTRLGALAPSRRAQLATAVAALDLQDYRGSGPRRRAA